MRKLEWGNASLEPEGIFTEGNLSRKLGGASSRKPCAHSIAEPAFSGQLLQSHR
jgi:hypothetical protein